MFDDIGSGFICGELNVVNILVAKTACARDVTHELSDLIEKFKFRRKLNRLHRVFKSRLQPCYSLKTASFLMKMIGISSPEQV